MPQKGKTLEASRRRLTGSASIPLQVTAEAIDDQCETLDDDEIIVVTALDAVEAPAKAEIPPELTAGWAGETA
jgi:hypothetical protein